MSHKDYSYVGDPIPQLSMKDNPDFFLIFQKAVIYSLKKRNLLTDSQCDLCIERLERQYREASFGNKPI